MTAERTITDLRSVIEWAITNDPRSLQVQIGPSGIGNACDRCLVHTLAGHTTVEHVVPWLPTVGKAVHTWLSGAILRHWVCQGDDAPQRFLTDHRVTVVEADDQPSVGVVRSAVGGVKESGDDRLQLSRRDFAGAAAAMCVLGQPVRHTGRHVGESTARGILPKASWVVCDFVLCKCSSIPASTRASRRSSRGASMPWR